MVCPSFSNLNVAFIDLTHNNLFLFSQHNYEVSQNEREAGLVDLWGYETSFPSLSPGFKSWSGFRRCSEGTCYFCCSHHGQPIWLWRHQQEINRSKVNHKEITGEKGTRNSFGVECSRLLCYETLLLKIGREKEQIQTGLVSYWW